MNKTKKKNPQHFANKNTETEIGLEQFKIHTDIFLINKIYFGLYIQ